MGCQFVDHAVDRAEVGGQATDGLWGTHADEMDVAEVGRLAQVSGEPQPTRPHVSGN